MSERSPNTLTKVLALASVVEIGTGLALIGAPALVVRLLLGFDLVGVAMALARLAGIALFALGVACWPNQQRSTSDTAAFRGMLVYNLLVALFLAYLFIAHHMGGVLLWPGVLLHAVIAVLMAGTRRNERKTEEPAK